MVIHYFVIIINLIIYCKFREGRTFYVPALTKYTLKQPNISTGT